MDKVLDLSFFNNLLTQTLFLLAIDIPKPRDNKL